jgi:hypothetical protein
MARRSTKAKGTDMTKRKGPKKAKLEFTVKRIERKQTRHLKGAALAEAQAKIEAGKKPSGSPKA